MTRFAKLRYVRIAGLAAGAVVVAGGAVLITASAAGLSIGFRPTNAAQAGTNPTTTSISQASSASSVCTDFISHLSTDVGKSQSQVDAAVQKAIGETLADEVKNGTLTQAQATAIQKKLASRPLCTLAAGLGKRPSARSAIGAYKQQLLAAAASALGVSPTDLQADLAKGMTLSQVAAAQKPPVTEAEFRTRLVAQLKPLLDTAVANHKLTSAQEMLILEQLQAGPIPYWSKPMHTPKSSAPASPATT